MTDISMLHLRTLIRLYQSSTTPDFWFEGILIELEPLLNAWVWASHVERNEFEDAYQAALLGLFKALPKIDTSAPNPLAYIRLYVLDAIEVYAKRHQCCIHVSRKQRRRKSMQNPVVLVNYDDTRIAVFPENQ